MLPDTLIYICKQFKDRRREVECFFRVRQNIVVEKGTANFKICSAENVPAKRRWTAATIQRCRSCLFLPKNQLQLEFGARAGAVWVGWRQGLGGQFFKGVTRGRNWAAGGYFFAM